MIEAICISETQAKAFNQVELVYSDRVRRRLAMTCVDGFEFLLNLPHVVELKNGDHIELEDGRQILVKAAQEALMSVKAKNALHLSQTAWHIGNRHLACEIHEDHLLLLYDHVIQDMLEKQGCIVTKISAPFQPLGGAYGHGGIEGHHHHG